jgi:hypothetical protein
VGSLDRAESRGEPPLLLLLLLLLLPPISTCLARWRAENVGLSQGFLPVTIPRALLDRAPPIISDSFSSTKGFCLGGTIMPELAGRPSSNPLAPFSAPTAAAPAPGGGMWCTLRRPNVLGVKTAPVVGRLAAPRPFQYGPGATVAAEISWKACARRSDLGFGPAYLN